VWWHKPNPSNPGNDYGTTGKNPAYQPRFPPAQLMQDNMFFDVLLNSHTDISISVGGTELRATVHTGAAGIRHFSIPYGNYRGQVV
jgi:hypothetical protein